MGARIWWTAACLAGLLAVAGGAFGAHGLKDAVTPERLVTWHTGTEYLAYHALALLSLAWLSQLKPGRDVDAAGVALLGGMVVFSGSLWALVLLDQPVLGAITPLGGVSFLVGWALAARAGWRRLGPRP